MTADGRSELEAYEVFQQEKEATRCATAATSWRRTPELAVHYAREMFGRRNESTRLWVVRRADIVVLDDPDLLDPPLDRSFKKPGGYVMRDKLAAARAPGGQAEAEGTIASMGGAGVAPPADRRPRSPSSCGSMADDEFVIGFTDSEWTGIAPLLEEDVAMSSIAQDELGHAAALYGLLADLTDGRCRRARLRPRARRRTATAGCSTTARGDWAMTIARRFLYDSRRRRPARGARSADRGRR